MMIGVKSETLLLDKQILSLKREFDIDALIQDILNIETDIFMSLSNYDKIQPKNRSVVIKEFESMKIKISNIIHSKLQQASTAINDRTKAQITQRNEQDQNQCKQEIKFKDQNQLDFNSALSKSVQQRYKDAFTSFQDTVLQSTKQEQNEILEMAKKGSLLIKNTMTSMVNSQLDEQDKQFKKLVKDGYDIEQNAINDYIKEWLKQLDQCIDLLNQSSINCLDQCIYTFTAQTFEQFIYKSGRRGFIIKKNQVAILNELLSHQYVPQAETIEKLSDLLENKSCPNACQIITLIFLKCAENGCRLSPAVVYQMEKLLDNTEHSLIATLILQEIAKTQPLPISSVTKLCTLSGGKINEETLQLALQAISDSIKQEIALPDSIIRNLFDILCSGDKNNKMVKMISSGILQYFQRNKLQNPFTYSDQLIGIISSFNTDPFVYQNLIVIFIIGLDNGHQLLPKSINQLQKTFDQEKFLDNITRLAIILQLASIKCDTVLQSFTLEKIAPLIKNKEIDVFLRRQCSSGFLSIIKKNGQVISNHSVWLLIESMSDIDSEIRKDVNEVIMHLLKQNSGYTLSTEQIDKLGDVLADATNPEIQSNLAYVVGYYARKGFVSEQAANAIYGFVLSNSLNSQSIFALKHIFKKYPNQLPAKILHEIFQIAISLNYPIDLRIDALQCYYNDFENFNGVLEHTNIEKLLQDQNSAIKGLTIKLIISYVEKTNLLPDHLLESLSSNSSGNESLSQDALQILNLIAIKGGKLPQSALQFIEWVLFKNNDQATRAAAFLVLNKCKDNQTLTQEYKDLWEMEKILLDIAGTSVDSSTSITILKAGEKLEDLAFKGIILTKNCYEALNAMLTKKQLGGKNVAIISASTIMYAAESGQEIPVYILLTLKRCLQRADPNLSLAMAFQKVLNVTSYIDDEIINLVETQLMSDHISMIHKKYMRIALKIITARGKYLSDDMNKFISLSLKKTNQSCPIETMDFSEILRNIINNGQQLHQSIFEALERNLKSEHEAVRINTVKSFKSLSSTGYKISEHQIYLLRKLLQSDVKEEMEPEIIVILKNISTNKNPEVVVKTKYAPFIPSELSQNHSYPKQRFIEVELDDLINLLNASTKLKPMSESEQSNIFDRIVTLIDEMEFPPEKIIQILKHYLICENAQIPLLCAKGLAIIVNKALLGFTIKETENLALILTNGSVNQNVVSLLEDIVLNKGGLLSDITIEQLTISININASANYTKKILSILENVQFRQTFDIQQRDLYFLAKESLDISKVRQDAKKLLNIIETLKTKIILSRDLSDEQYECLNQGLKFIPRGKIQIEANICLDLLLKSSLIPSDLFIRQIFQEVLIDQFYELLKKVLLNKSKYSELLLTDMFAMFHQIIGENTSEQIKQNALSTLLFLSNRGFKLSEQMICFSQSQLDNVDINMQELALKILKNAADQGYFQLSDKYLKVLKALVDQLEFEHPLLLKSIKISEINPEDINISLALLNLEYINNSVIDSLSPEFRVRELISFDLMMRAGCKEIYDQDIFETNLIELEKKHNYAPISKDRDDILLSLTNLQDKDKHRYTITQINQILELLAELPQSSFQKIVKDGKDLIQELKHEWLKFNYFADLNIMEFKQLQNGFFEENNWTLSVTKSFLEQLPLEVTVDAICSFLRFLKESNVSANQISSLLNKPTDLDEHNILTYLQQVLSKQILKEYFAQELSKFSGQVNAGKDLIRLLEIGWSVSNIKLLAETILLKSNGSSVDLRKILKAIQDVYYYKIRDNYLNQGGLSVLSIIKNCNKDDIINKLHKLAIEQNFLQSLDKDIDCIIDEIADRNKDDLEVKGLIDNNILKCAIQQIERKYNSTSKILQNNKPIKHWLSDDIQQWSKLIRGELARRPENQAEILAVIKTANVLDSSHEPRIVQQLSILIMLKTQNTGRLLQVSTGEGKSMTVAMLTVVKALRGEVVDVVTSSSVLAKRDAEQKVAFYQMFNLTVKDNGDSDLEDFKYKDCYSRDIVYGSIENFQFDFLRDSHTGQNIRKKREFGVVIVDEVDSMLIDDGSKIAKLSSPMPAMEYLEQLLSLAWRHLSKIEERFCLPHETQQLIWIKCNFTYDSGQGMSLDCDDESYDDNIITVNDRWEFIRFLLNQYLENIINKSEGCFVVPQHLRGFALCQIDKWITSAIQAKHALQEGKHYLVIKEGNKSIKIVPVDYANTGLLHFNTSWQNGLHQFLEIKHGVKLTPENLTTSFISNMGYFNKYGNNIFGMTGTLGNEDTHEMLESIYPVKLCFIPTYRHKQFIELKGKIETTVFGWLESVTSSIISEAEKGRAVLVICETIANVKLFKEALVDNNYPQAKIHHYSRNDNDEYFVVNRNIDSGEILLATNLAGRGTDLGTTNSVENAGGLHVCLTYLPDNQRVEDQAFGRTARQGKIGTGQLIINQAETLSKLNYYHISITDISVMKDLRNSIEQSKMKLIRSSGLYKTLISDDLFLSYNELYNGLKIEETLIYKLKQLEEAWGLWLHKLNLDEYGGKSLSTLAFSSYLDTLDLQSQSIVKGEDSFYYSILHQLTYLKIQFLKASNVDALKLLIIRHLVNYQELYKNIIIDKVQFTSDYFMPSQWRDNLFIIVISRVFTVNIILVNSDKSSKNYQRIGATDTIYIGHEINGDYSSLMEHKLRRQDGTKFQSDIYFDNFEFEIQCSAQLRNNNKFQLANKLNQDFSTLNKVQDDNIGKEDGRKLIFKQDATTKNIETIKEWQVSIEILNYFKAASIKVAKTKGEQQLLDARVAFAEFRENILLEYRDNRIVKNLNYETKQANLLWQSESYDKALHHYDKAIALDDIYSFVAHYNKAYAVIGQNGVTQGPKQNLLSAKKQLEEYLIPQLESIQMVLVSDSDIQIESDLTKQITNKTKLLSLKLEHIDKALNVIANVEHKNQTIKEAVDSGTIKAQQASRFEIAIDKKKNLKEFFENAEIPQDEIDELDSLGLSQLYSIKEVEIKPKPPKKKKGFFKAFLGCVLGIGQIVFGALIIATGAASFGIALLVEGVKDIFKVVTGGFGEGFTWKNYFSSKAISFTVSAISMGWENFKLGMEAVKNGLTATASCIKDFALKLVGRETIQKGVLDQAAKNAFIESNKGELFKEAIKKMKEQIPKAILEVGAQHAIKFVSDKVADKLLQEFYDDIAGKVRGEISDVINNSETSRIIDRLVLIDTMLGTNKRITELMREMQETLRPEESFFASAASSIIKAIAQKFGHDIILSAASLANTISKVKSVTKKFCSKLKDKLSEIYNNLPNNQELFQIFIKAHDSPQQASILYNKLIDENILTAEGKIIEKDLSKIKSIDFAENNKYKENIITFCVKMQHQQDANNNELRVKLVSNIEHMITSRIMQLIKCEALSPMINSGISYVQETISKKLQEAAQVSKNGVKKAMGSNQRQVQFKKNKPQMQNGELSIDSKRLAVLSSIAYSARKRLQDYFNGSTSDERINDQLKIFSQRFPEMNLGDYIVSSSNQNQFCVVNHKTKDAIIVNRGTSFGISNLELNDLFLQDAQIFLGLKPNRHHSSLMFTHDCQDSFPDYHFTLTGHSLGGSISEHVAKETGLFCETFNRGSSPFNFNVQKESNITSYHVKEDMISMFPGLGQMILIQGDGHGITGIVKKFDKFDKSIKITQKYKKQNNKN